MYTALWFAEELKKVLAVLRVSRFAENTLSRQESYSTHMNSHIRMCYLHMHMSHLNKSTSYQLIFLPYFLSSSVIN